MTAIARPGTPFPHDERSMHSYMSALPGPSTSRHRGAAAPRYSPRSLHFPLAELPVPTPPSLLKRRTSNASQASSSGSDGIRRNSSTSTLGAAASPAPFALHMSGSLSRRRESARSSSSFSSSSSSSGSEPRTPVLRARPGYEPEAEILEADDEYDPETEYDLGEPALSYRALSKHTLSAVSSRYTHATTRALAPRLPTIESPQRPKLVRRGTPRPAQTLSTLGMTPADGDGPDKRYISIIDGGAWLVRH